MPDLEFLDLEDVLRMVRRLGVGPVRDVGLLASAVARPRASAFGVDAYPTLELKAAALLHALVSNHALVDGNKGLGWLAFVVFLGLNGTRVELEDDGAFDLVVGVAEGRLDLADVTERIAGAPR